MYVAEEPFSPPSDPHIKIWRYVDFAKFLSLIDSSTLHFARLDQMEDECEGAFSEASFDTIVSLIDGEEGKRMEQELNQQHRKTMDFVREVNRKGIFVNCWHMSEIESAAMWKIYSGLGIAVQSTSQRLADSFIDPHEPVFISTIRYEDFIKVPMSFGRKGWTEPVLYKRRMFDYEREIRAFWLNPPSINGKIDLEVSNHPTGYSLNIDVATLVERIYVSPGRRRWFRRLVRNILDKYGYTNIPIAPSHLDDIPHTRSWKEEEITGVES